jgi:acetolactate synthase-1/2/3 large subunit
MANGYFRASGKLAAVATIPGPGFAYAVAGLAEAAHDSVALIHIAGAPAAAAGRKFQFQAIDQSRIATSLVKCVIELDDPGTAYADVSRACLQACAGEPGPVMIHWHANGARSSRTGADAQPEHRQTVWSTAPTSGNLEPLLRQISSARRPLLLAGQGCASAAPVLQTIVELLAVPVLTSGSGRGVLPEDHPLSFAYDFTRADVSILNDLIETSDCIVAIGCKLSHGGTGGYRLALPAERLIHVDASPDVIGANYPVQTGVVLPAELFLQQLMSFGQGVPDSASTWTTEEVARWRTRLRQAPRNVAEPTVNGLSPSNCAQLFSLIRDALPRNGILVTDSGLHQGLARRHFDVLSPRGLIAPSDFQSMGFGIPAAIGAKIAAPERPVVVVIGDGAFAMSAMEMITAVREAIPITVIVFNDGFLNQIRLQQHENSGFTESVTLVNPDFQSFAEAIGARYALLGDDAEQVLATAVAHDGVTLVEARLGDSLRMTTARVRSMGRNTLRRALGPRLVGWLKTRMRRRS